MTIKTPKFWYDDNAQNPTRGAFLLSIAAPFYNAAQTLHRFFSRPKSVSAPVICVGNITAGGSGKTPTAIALMDLIKSHNIAQNPFFLTRGYAGNITAPTVVDVALHTHHDCGDEALLLAKHAPTIVSRNRYAGAKMAVQNGADLIVMDDGLQNYHLKKDLSFMVMNGAMGAGNGRILPAGPLRESFKSGLKKTDAVIFIGDDMHGIKREISAQISVFNAHLCPVDTPHNTLKKGANIFAFAGLGYPEKFFTHLKDARGLKLHDGVAFSDHHPYTVDDLTPIISRAKAVNATVVTTDKDYLRVPTSLRSYIIPLGIMLKFNDNAGLIALLQAIQNKG